MHKLLVIIGIFTAQFGCGGDVTSSEGERGNLRYSLTTDYESEVSELTQLALTTRYEHHIYTHLTTRGENVAGDVESGEIRHSASAGRLEQDAEQRSFSITVDAPADVMIQSSLDGDIIDQLPLRFEDPDAIELKVWIRAPWEEDWQRADPGSLEITTGTQIGFLAIPLFHSERLGGDFEPEIEPDSRALVVPDAPLRLIQEGGVTESRGLTTFYAVDVGTVVFAVLDPEHQIEVRQRFLITE